MARAIVLTITALPALTAACGSDVTSAPRAGGEGGGAAASTSATATTATSTTGSGGGLCGGPAPEGPCAPPSGCPGASSPCLALEDNCGKSSAVLRVAQVSFSKPDVLVAGAVAAIVRNAAVPDVPSCNLQGSATFSWLLELDTQKGTLKTGVARPVADPLSGYCFANETLSLGGTSFTLVPVVAAATVGAEGALTVETIDALLLPIFFDSAGNDALMLPVREAKFHDTTLSAGGSCIGAYNAAGLAPDNLCLPKQGAPLFLEQGSFGGHIALEEADGVIVKALNESLCVLLSPDPVEYSDGGSPKRCKRDANGVIVLAGDFCAMSNHAATPTCHDAMQVDATFAASGVRLRDGC